MEHKRLKAMLAKHEGIYNFPYKCPAGRWTVGIGRNIQDNGLSNDEIAYLLNNDIKRCLKELQGFSFYPYLNEARRDALTDMLFNLGLPRFKKFKKMIAALNNRDWTRAGSEMLDSKWSRDVGRRAYELARIVIDGEYAEESVK